ncbi:hypothetical protein BDP27DRAFT_1492484 [Rhodocollybia butyracea]|uniref:Uncharacterized protein n=1 Tax=Rhodocollybia butyracea TaxID=206335 RepID=A0A9P5TZS7_9AGAR|nr:hypothetical protein BDP27DRAFT_1492484 [Rhodocollybia butyracea]
MIRIQELKKLTNQTQNARAEMYSICGSRRKFRNEVASLPATGSGKGVALKVMEVDKRKPTAIGEVGSILFAFLLSTTTFGTTHLAYLNARLSRAACRSREARRSEAEAIGKVLALGCLIQILKNCRSCTIQILLNGVRRGKSRGKRGYGHPRKRNGPKNSLVMLVAGGWGRDWEALDGRDLVEYAVRRESAARIEKRDAGDKSVLSGPK